MSLSLASFKFLLEILAKVDQNRVNALRLEQVLAPDCSLATFRKGGMGFKDVALALHGLRLGLNCTSCDSSHLQQLSKKWNEQEAEQLNNFTAFLNAALVNVSTYLEGPKFQNFIDEYILNATAVCAKEVPPLEWAPTVPSSSSSKDADTASEEPSQERVSSSPDVVMNVLGETLQNWWTSVG